MIEFTCRTLVSPTSVVKKTSFTKILPAVFIILFQFFSLASSAQRVINGVVRDAKGAGIPDVTITEKGKNATTVTDNTGSYSLSVSGSNPVLIFTSTGFKLQEVAVNGRSEVSLTMDEHVSKLDEVVVIGYGSQSRQKLTTAVSKLDTRVLENATFANIGTALEGNIPGLQVQSTGGGQPGAAPRIILRGGTSINNPNGAAPLYIVDGVIRPNGLNDINGAAIESIQVLKDAASTAIYGARGSNGVIIATTKSGRPNRTRIGYTVNASLARPLKLMEYASAQDYIYWNRLGVKAAAAYNATLINRLTQANGSGTGNDLTNATAFTTMYLSPANQFKLGQGWQSMLDPIDPTKTIIFNETNYQDLIYRNAFTNDHYLDLSGGTDRATFYAGLGYLNSQGVAIETNYKRLSFNLNGSYKVTDNFNVFGKLQYTYRTNKTIANLANLFYRSASLPGTAKYTFEDGSIAPGQNSSIGNPDYYFTGPYAPKGNTADETTTMALGGRWTIVKGLTFEPLASIFRESAPVYSFQPAALLNGVGTLVTTRNQSASNNGVRQYQADAVLTYQQTFAAKHNVEIKGGFSHYFRENTTLSASGQNAATDLITTLNAAGSPTAISSTISDLIIQSGFARINYDYESKYLLSLNARYDGASNLGEKNKFGFFPGISAGWNIYREKFYENLLSPNTMQLKLRASYGVNGNISGLGDFQPQGSYTTTSLYGGQSAILSGQIPNQNLKWELSKTLDFGADVGLFNNKVGIIFDYYVRRTDNLLTTVSLPASTGFASVFTNFGNLENRGVELELNIDVLPSKSALKWQMFLNAAKTSRKILKLPFNGIDKNRQGGVLVYDPSSKSYVYLGGLQEGGRVGDLFAYKQLGIYATDVDAAKAPIDNIAASANKTRYGGDVQWADLDGNGILDSRDQVYVGNPYPTWSGGFNNFLTYKGLSLNIRTDFTTGNTIYNYPAVIANSQAQGDALPLKSYIDKMWKTPGQTTTVPRYTWQDQSGNIFKGNSTYYEKGDFLAIREVSLGYRLPESLVRRAKLSSARISFTVTNLHYFTAFTGLNPEDGGMDNGHYPIARTYAVGLNINL
ncbi:MAG: SusC/RagA family TonB-linked outer membrane protein [Chitinophagaceae bacterium]|nr:MAG: SusC/RagA family TonB-linked outer membrane protein [Chitinophagaceae bacterium]